MTTAVEVKAAKKSAIQAAMDLAEAVAAGTVAATDLEAAAVDAARDLFGVVAGPADPLWPIHVENCRQVLALGGVPANELAEWAAVQRQAEGGQAAAPAVSWMERALEDYDEDGDRDGYEG